MAASFAATERYLRAHDVDSFSLVLNREPAAEDELDAIALSLNTRQRARLEYESPLVVYTQHIALLQHS